jgi:Fe-S-cluster containining protein
MDIQEIAQKARESLSEYCMGECAGYCCRKGYLILTRKEADLLVPTGWQELKDNQYLIELIGQKYSLNLGNHMGACPRLTKDFKCSIHTHEGRPSACKEFPVFIDGNQVRLSKRCFGVKAGLLYPFVRQFIEAGCAIC